MRNGNKKEKVVSPPLIIAIGAALGLILLGWLIFARSDDDKVSSSGFSEGGAGGAAPSFSFEHRTQTGLSMVRGAEGGPPPSSVVQTETGGAPPGATSAPAPSATAAGGAGLGGPAAENKAGSDSSAEAAEKAALAAGGLPADPKGLSEIGFKRKMLMTIAAKMMDHPAVVKALFNNKYVVDAMMNRDDVKQNCESQSSLQSYLTNPSASQPMVQMLQSALSNPTAAAAVASTDLVSRIASCPSITSISQNPAAVAQVVTATPGILQMLTDPRTITALTSNAGAMAQLNNVQSSMGGGAAP